jgi:hypothetical protein
MKKVVLIKGENISDNFFTSQNTTVLMLNKAHSVQIYVGAKRTAVH